MFFLSFWILPLISAFTWLGMLLAMLIVWLKEGSPHYASMSPEQHIAYISDIGAEGLKPLFIAGACVTTIFLDLSFASERWLRHTGRLAMNTTKAEKVLSVFAIIFAIAGTFGLVLLSIFDTLRHPHLHDGFLLLFIAGYIISAIFTCAEYQRLGAMQRQHRILRISFWVKLVFIIVEVILAVVFAVETFRDDKNVGAVIEWTIALIFTLWVFSFYIDLQPAVRTKKSGGGFGIPQLEIGHADSDGHIVTSAEAEGEGTDRYASGRVSRQSNTYPASSHNGFPLENAHENGFLHSAPPMEQQPPPLSQNF